MGKNNSQLEVKGEIISVTKFNEEDYICITDMVKNAGDEVSIYSWLRNRNTVEFLGVWEQIHNPDFKPIEFDRFKKEAGLNSFALSPKKWVDTTGAIGIISKSGRYGGTYAHKDIAFEFGAWLSAEFKLLLIKEFQRLKEKELELEHWDYRRFLTKVNYKIHTDSVKEIRIPRSKLPENMKGIVYAEEADLLNVALFGLTAAEWRKQTPEAKKSENIRDHANIHELTVLSNLESMNAHFLRQGLDQYTRLTALRDIAVQQLRSLAELPEYKVDPLASLKARGALEEEVVVRLPD